MNKRHISRIGNTLMAVGLVVCMAGILLSVAGEMSGVTIPQGIDSAAIVAIFSGALLWLTGAHIGGRQKVTDKYYLIKYHRRHRLP